MIYGYIRVSTDKQDCENQKLSIESKASATGLCPDGVKWNLDKLKKSGKIRRVGPDRGGHWEIE